MFKVRSLVFVMETFEFSERQTLKIFQHYLNEPTVPKAWLQLLGVTVINVDRVAQSV